MSAFVRQYLISTEISLIEMLDNSDKCDGKSRLGYYGLILWISLVIYLFIGLYILCGMHL